jgi:MOB kinase activator 1
VGRQTRTDVSITIRQGTVKLTKKHSTFKRGMLSQMTSRTLGTGNMKAAVQVPEGEDKCEWLAANTVDFFNELSLLYGLVSEQAQEKYSKAGEGFPSGFEYRWADGQGKP